MTEDDDSNFGRFAAGPRILDIECTNCSETLGVTGMVKSGSKKVTVIQDKCTNCFQTFNNHIRCLNSSCGLCYPKLFNKCPKELGGCGRAQNGKESSC